MVSPHPQEAARQLFERASTKLAALDLAIGAKVGSMPSVADARRRRLGDSGLDDTAGFLTLVQGRDGLFDWRVDGGPARQPVRRAARRGLFDAVPIDQTAFKPVMGSEVSRHLSQLDKSFNSRYGLYDLAGRRVDQVAASGRVLLIIHGTFSKCEQLVSQLRAAPGDAGRELLAAAQSRYQQLLLFEHPTLAVGPWLNALDLARAFASSAAEVDIICHSRGGLVARWWLEVLSPQLRPRARVLFFGSPLLGTGLASPYRLRSALKMLTNYALAAQQASQVAALALPMFAVVQGLMALVASGSAALAHTPVADAAVAMVPGLAAMSRYGPDGAQFVQGNCELEKLAFGWKDAPQNYFAVSSNFEPTDPGWRFWEHFRHIPGRVADSAADVLFAGANDLVVDTASMTQIGVATQIAAPARRLDFGTNGQVHHLNYFSQPKAVAFVRSALGL